MGARKDNKLARQKVGKWAERLASEIAFKKIVPALDEALAAVVNYGRMFVTEESLTTLVQYKTPTSLWFNSALCAPLWDHALKTYENWSASEKTLMAIVDKSNMQNTVLVMFRTLTSDYDRSQEKLLDWLLDNRVPDIDTANKYELERAFPEVFRGQ